jgi:hypothetical protein
MTGGAHFQVISPIWGSGIKLGKDAVGEVCFAHERSRTPPTADTWTQIT